MLVLGFGGKPGSGKTTAADAIKASFPGVGVYSVSDLICAELGVKREDVKDARILQDHGTRQREKDRNYWIKKVLDSIRQDDPRIAVIPNIRMHTEVLGVRILHGRLIRYTCLNANGTEYNANDRDMKHVLETELDDFNWDHYITAKCGESRLVELQTFSLVGYLLHRESKSPHADHFEAARHDQNSGVPLARPLTPPDSAHS